MTSPRTAEQTAASEAALKPAGRTETAGNLVSLSPDAEKLAGIEIGRVEERALEGAVKTTGEVLANANQVSHVTTPVTGRVVDVRVKVGDHIATGQTMLTIHSPEIEQAEADLLQNEGQVRADLKRDLLQIDSDLATAVEQLKLSESTYNRMKSLFDQRIASQADYQAALTQWEKDKITLETLKKKRVATIALSIERMKIVTEPATQKLRLLGLTEAEINQVRRTRRVDPIDTVDAPAGGVVSERMVNPGEMVDPTKQLFTIGAYDTVWIKADIYEKDLSKVREGQGIELNVDSFPGVKFRGELNYVSDTINPDTRTLSVRAEVPNPGFKLKPRMFVRMRVLTGAARTVAIPQNAVQDAGENKVVYVPLGTGRYQERQVKLGSNYDDWVQVLEGLHPGERVVTRGSFELRSQSLRERN